MTTEVANRSTGPLKLMLAVAIVPMLGAYLIFFTGWGMPKETVNNGLFLTPAVSVQGFVDKASWAEINKNKKWRFMIPLKNGCSDECITNLVTSRQVHIRLDQKSKRVERYAVIMDNSFSDTQRQAIQAEHPKLKIVQPNVSQAEQWINGLSLPENLPSEYYLLVDQEGRAMMVYHNDHHGNDVLKDVKRALKFSIDYQ